MIDLSNINQWKQYLGLLPVSLFPDNQRTNQFILLDGVDGDFCLELDAETRQDDYFSYSWSSNTKNFVSVQTDSVTVYNWIKTAVDRVSRKSVAENIEKFYSFLAYNSPKSERDIVPFILEYFRKLRNLTADRSDGSDALELLFLLLGCYEDSSSPMDLDKELWGLSQINPPHGFEDYVSEFSEGIGNLTPNVKLILRHSSGVLFQEARRSILYFDRSTQLFSKTLSDRYVVEAPSKSTSIHYTPPFLARTIVENALNIADLTGKTNLKIMDPACGSSEFLMEALKQLKSRNYPGRVTVIGLDSSRSAITTSKFLLSYEKREWGDRLSIDVRLVEDSLTEEWSVDNDIILMNPPFMSWEEMCESSQDAVRDSLGAYAKNRPNQASAFLHRAVDALTDGGVIGSVLPSSIFTLDSYDSLRTALLDKLSFKLVGKLGNFVFQEALTDISVLVSKRSDERECPLVLWSRNAKGIVPTALRSLRLLQAQNIPLINSADFSIYPANQFPINENNWKLISFREHKLFEHLEMLVTEKTLTRVSNVFTVKQGIRTGNNLVFKVPLTYYESLPESEKVFFRPVIDNDAIQNRVLLERDYLWYPYDIDGLTIPSEAELREKAPTYFHTHLLPNRDKLLSRVRIDAKNWWTLSESRTWQRDRFQKLVSTEFGRADSFAFDEKGEFLIERGYGWIPKGDFKDMDDFYFFLGILANPFFDNLLSIYSRQLAGGNWYDLGKKHTKEIPIPRITKSTKESGAYDRISAYGKAISVGDQVSEDAMGDFIREYIYFFPHSTNE